MPWNVSVTASLAHGIDEGVGDCSVFVVFDVIRDLLSSNLMASVTGCPALDVRSSLCRVL